jgi:hypothetical protein
MVEAIRADSGARIASDYVRGRTTSEYFMQYRGSMVLRTAEWP